MKTIKSNGSFISIIFLIIIMFFSAVFMLDSSYKESSIMDELAHIPAGYSYIKYFDYRLNPEHPPIVKALAAFPLLFMHLNFPTDKTFWKSGINRQWISGNEFIYKYNDGKADKIVDVARIFPIIITLLFVLSVYIWSKELLGNYWALLPTLFIALSPNILAHGHYVTTDIGAALGFILGMYFFSHYLIKSNRKNMIFAGVFFGVAELLKFSTVLLVPIFFIMILFRWWGKIFGMNIKIFSKKSILVFWRYLKNFITVLIIGYLVVWVVYFIFTINYPIVKQVNDTKTILSSFAGGEKGISACFPQYLSMRCLAEINIFIAGIPIIRALGQYMLGVLMVMQRSSGGNTAYFLNKVGGGGWWYYFPTIFVLKETIPVLLLILIGLFGSIKRIILGLKKSTHIKRIRISLSNYLNLNFAESGMIILVIFYWIYSIRSPLNIGFRHILPTLPFIYILSVSSIKKWVELSEINAQNIFSRFTIAMKNGAILFAKYSFLIILIIWFLSEVITSAPYFLSYYNEFAGGIWNGYKYATDSNYDWGQDLKRLKDYVFKNNIDKIAVDYFGGGDVKYYLGNRAVLWNGNKNNPINHGIKWLAISINTIASAKAIAYPGFKKANSNAYQYITDFKNPYDRAGTSIFIYRLRE